MIAKFILFSLINPTNIQGENNENSVRKNNKTHQAISSQKYLQNSHPPILI